MIDELTPADDGEYGPPPAYGTPGRALIIVRTDPLEIEALAHDSDTSVFWLAEGMGIAYWVEHEAKMSFIRNGHYVIEGITGCYHKGDGYVTDDDEEWSWVSIREATPEEIDAEALF